MTRTGYHCPNELAGEKSDTAFIREQCTYERRIVAFLRRYGMAEQNRSCGGDIEKITELKNVIRLFAMFPDKDKYPFDLRPSTF
jgi:hypothetical protein